MAREVEMEATGFLHLARLGIVSMLCHPLSKLPPCHPTICGSLLVVDVVEVLLSDSVVLGVDSEIVATFGASPQVDHVLRFAV